MELQTTFNSLFRRDLLSRENNSEKAVTPMYIKNVEKLCVFYLLLNKKIKGNPLNDSNVMYSRIWKSDIKMIVGINVNGQYQDGVLLLPRYDVKNIVDYIIRKAVAFIISFDPITTTKDDVKWWKNWFYIHDQILGRGNSIKYRFNERTQKINEQEMEKVRQQREISRKMEEEMRRQQEMSQMEEEMRRQQEISQMEEEMRRQQEMSQMEEEMRRQQEISQMKMHNVTTTPSLSEYDSNSHSRSSGSNIESSHVNGHKSNTNSDTGSGTLSTQIGPFVSLEQHVTPPRNPLAVKDVKKKKPKVTNIGEVNFSSNAAAKAKVEEQESKDRLARLARLASMARSGGLRKKRTRRQTHRKNRTHKRKH